MPLPLLAHQAPVLPLKLWRPAAFNGLALVLGSMAPDFEYFLQRPLRASTIGHTLGGQFGFCLPTSMVVVLLVGHLRLGAVVAARLPGLRPLVGLAVDVRSANGILRAIASVLAGSFSHLLLDAITHDTLPRVLPDHVFRIGGVSAATPTMIQLVASAVGAVITLVLLRRLWLQNASNAAPPPRPGAPVIGAFAGLGAVVGLGLALPAIRHPGWYFDAGKVYVWGHTAFFVACGIGLGVIVGATLLALWDRSAYGRNPATNASGSVEP